MQLGNDFQLGRDTVALIRYINENNKEGISNELRMIINYDLNTLLLYNRGKLILENEYFVKDNEETEINNGISNVTRFL